MATGKHQGLLGLGIWDVAGGGGQKRKAWDRAVGGSGLEGWELLTFAFLVSQKAGLELVAESQEKELQGVIL